MPGISVKVAASRIDCFNLREGTLPQIMTGLLFASLLAVQSPAPTRFDMGERLKTLEGSWMKADEQKKRAAIPFISQAVTSFFTQQFGPACRSLDSASAALAGRPLKPEDGITLRFLPGHSSTDGKIRLSVTWAYTLPDAQPVKVDFQGVTTDFKPGESGVVELDVARLPMQNTGLSDSSLSLSIKVGADQRALRLFVGNKFKERASALAANPDSDIAILGRLLTDQAEGKTEQDIDLVDVMSLGEKLASGSTPKAVVKDWPLAIEGSTRLRARFPDQQDANETLVIALHGAGGSENLFFEGYGRGLAVDEAIKRKWAIIAPRSSAAAVKDSLAWVKRVRGWTPKRVIVMGHSMGGALALQSGSVTPKPNAVVLFAPAGRQVPESLKEVPMYLAVGRQEIMMLGASAQEIRKSREAAPNFRFNLVDPCEHLMIVAEALPDAYKWLDETLKR
jgi:predicted esterase